MPGYVYLLHFERPMHHAQHYIGSTKHIRQRMQEHRGNSDVKIVRAFKERGIDFKVARVWNFWGIWNARFKERDLKRHSRNARNLCPYCRSKAKPYRFPNTGRRCISGDS